jgi:hypothetical protein
MSSLAAALFSALGVASAAVGQAPATMPGGAPDFGPNVLIFDPSMTTIQARLDEVYKTQEAGQFNDKRFALLFKPGSYNLDVQVGFYTHVAGLGASPDDVHITGAVRSKAKWMRNNNATCNFWRAVENLSVMPTADGDMNVWAVSQATAMRRVHINGDLHLWDGGWSSGGFLADCVVDGKVVSGSQQQWLSRNVEWNEWNGGNWNMVFVGTTNPPAGTWPEKPYTTIERTPLVLEKPYLTVDASGRYAVVVPPLRIGSKGASWTNASESGGEVLSIENFFIAQPQRDDAKAINAAIASGKHVIFTPGIYHLDTPIRITRPGTIVLGLGFATLMPMNGTPAMTVADIDGVKIAGLLFDSSAKESPVLLEVGEPGKSASHANDPIVLSDIFCRAGGPAVGRVKSFLNIHARDVIGDNFWLWRADHGEGAKWDQNINANGLIVNGEDVTIYGLFVEHTQEYQTLWNADGGRVYLYQSEMPYDPPSQEAWSHDGVGGYASYKVANTVTTHEAWGLGVYCVFTAAPVVAETAFEAPDVPGVQLHHMLTRRLSGQAGSGIRHVLNDRGAAAMDHQNVLLNESR